MYIVKLYNVKLYNIKIYYVEKYIQNIGKYEKNFHKNIF